MNIYAKDINSLKSNDIENSTLIMDNGNLFFYEVPNPSDFFDKFLGNYPNFKLFYMNSFDIDEEMFPIIQILNQKGYTTTYCCSGHLHKPYNSIFDHNEIKILPHIETNETRTCAYLLFALFVKLPYLPKSWKFYKSDAKDGFYVIRHYWTKKQKECFKDNPYLYYRKRVKLLQNLYEWALSLPEYDEIIEPYYKILRDDKEWKQKYVNISKKCYEKLNIFDNDNLKSDLKFKIRNAMWKYLNGPEILNRPPSEFTTEDLDISSKIDLFEPIALEITNRIIKKEKEIKKIKYTNHTE